MPIKFNKRFKSGLAISTIVLLSACAASLNNTSNKDQGISAELMVKASELVVPQQWSNSLKQLDSSENWLLSFDDPQLINTVKQALVHNFQLKQQALAVDIKKQQLVNAGSKFWPDWSASVVAGHRKNTQTSNSASWSLNSSVEFDLWGKLSVNEQKANAEWLAQQANFEQAQQQLPSMLDITPLQQKNSYS